MTEIYNPWLVALSVIIAVFASFTVFHLAGRFKTSRRFTMKSLLAMSALAMGGGIWSMHFVAMLAFALPVPVNYDVLITLISLLVAIFMTGVGLFTVSYREMTPTKLSAGGVFMGVGIVSMHYIGMAAMRVQAVLVYDPPPAAASVGNAIPASQAAPGVALTAEARLAEVRARLARDYDGVFAPGQVDAHVESYVALEPARPLVALVGERIETPAHGLDASVWDDDHRHETPFTCRTAHRHALRAGGESARPLRAS